MKTKLLLISVVLLTTEAFAQNACLIEGTVASEAVRDCTETSMAIPADQYAAECKTNANGPLKATVVKTCPAKAQAVCIDPYGVSVKVYYYLRSTQSLADTKTSCIAQKGKWVDRPN